LKLTAFFQHTFLPKSPLFLVGLLSLALFQSQAVQAQEGLPSTRVAMDAEIFISTCTSFPVSKLFSNALVSNLPAINSTVFLDDVFGPVSKVDIIIRSALSSDGCVRTGKGLTNIKLIFDSDLAAVAPRSGLLRNSASFRPAQNVLVQLGLVDDAGVFTPLDLNQPQALNDALAQQNDAEGGARTLTLGIRYVASRSVLAQNTNLQTADANSREVSEGNVSVFLPFLLKVN